MKMLEFLNIQIVIGLVLTLLASLFILWGSYINSQNDKNEIIKTVTEELLKNINNNNLAGALKVFNEGDLTIKKAIIIDLKNRAIDNSNERQKIIDFLSTLNDWVTEEEEYKDILLSPESDWARWFDYKGKNYLEKDGNVFEKEKQILSKESSNAISEIIFKHTQEPKAGLLKFRNKNFLGIKFLGFNFKYGNIDFLGVNFFGTYFIEVKNIDKTDFQYANYYGDILFKGMSLPNNSYVLGEYGTRYYGNVSFFNVEFPQGVSFIDAVINGKFIINRSVFKENAHFEIANFKGMAQFFRCRFEKGAMFTSAIFNKKAIFDNSEFLGKTQFVDEQFLEGYSFKGAKFSQKPNLDKIDTYTPFIDLR